MPSPRILFDGHQPKSAGQNKGEDRSDTRGHQPTQATAAPKPLPKIKPAIQIKK